MKKVLIHIAVITSLLFVPAKSFSTEEVKYRFVLSIYDDNWGGGLKYPEGIACSEDSKVIAADTANSRLIQYTLNGRKAKTDMQISLPQLLSPVQVRLDSKGDIYALDGKTGRIVHLGSDGVFMKYLEPELHSGGSSTPRSFDIDGDNNIYILDIAAEGVIVLNREGEFVKIIRFPREYGFFSDISVDFKGSILLLDSISARLYASDKSFPVFFPFTDSMRPQVRFPASLATDKSGRIYIADRNSSRIVIMAPDGSYLGKMSEMGWKEGQLNYPSQICINSAGKVFIADTNNSRVQVFELIQ
jgi:sugar lactone lactonase YvrE